jgi:hypothetical protein
MTMDSIVIDGQNEIRIKYRFIDIYTLLLTALVTVNHVEDSGGSLLESLSSPGSSDRALINRVEKRQNDSTMYMFLLYDKMSKKLTFST